MPDQACFDFVVHGGAPLTSLVRAYGLESGTLDEGQTVGELLISEIGSAIRLGARARLGPIDLVVHTLDREGGIDAVALLLDPVRSREI